MKRSKAIKQAEKRAVRRWVKRYQSTYAGVMADKDAQIERLTGERDAAQERVRQLDADCANLRAGIDDSKGAAGRDTTEKRAEAAEANVARLQAALAEEQALHKHLSDKWRVLGEIVGVVQVDNERLTAALATAQNEARGSEAYATSLRPCDAQTLAYAENWRLVLAMPTDYRLDHECGEYRVDVYRGPREGDRWHKAPEEALRAAGVTVPEPEPTDTGDDVAASLRAEDKRGDGWAYDESTGFGKGVGYKWTGPEKAAEADTAGGPTDTDRLDFLESLRRNGRSVGGRTFSAWHVVIDFTAAYDGEPVTVRQAIDAEREQRRRSSEEGEGAEQ